jgi:hypothetical protein
MYCQRKQDDRVIFNAVLIMISFIPDILSDDYFALNQPIIHMHRHQQHHHQPAIEV